ncbi:MAG: hypothetical protein HY026_04455 [Deltaproteobacteria bacterium]|nr:hypothetical protein [Deltaproteobacteria bacterium]
MATIFTKTTELSVAFGLLDIDPLKSTYNAIADRVDKLNQDTYDAVITELSNSEKAKIYEKLRTVGNDIRMKRFDGKPIFKVEWMGLSKQRKTVAVSKDLYVKDHNLFISVKTDSNVVFNLSPYNLLQALPTGSPTAIKEINWFLHTAHEKYDELYQFVRSRFKGASALPLTISEFDKSAGKTTKKEVQKWLDNLNSGQKSDFEGLYVAMCYTVAEKSSHLFMENRRNVKRSQLNSANELILKTFLRLNSAPYLLAGLEGGNPFAVDIPDVTKWFEQWMFTDIKAKADPDRKQCVVNFVLKLTNKENNKVVELPYHAEIRWSHGKFCGNPEGKLYKDFKWVDVPLLLSLRKKAAL